MVKVDRAEAHARVLMAKQRVTAARQRLKESLRMSALAKRHLETTQAALKAAQAVLAKTDEPIR